MKVKVIEGEEERDTKAVRYFWNPEYQAKKFSKTEEGQQKDGIPVLSSLAINLINIIVFLLRLRNGCPRREGTIQRPGERDTFKDK